MSSDFKTRLRHHPLAPKRPNIAVADPSKPVTPVVEQRPSPFLGAAQVRQPAFEIPVDQGNANITLDSLVALSKNGSSVPMPVAREMTAEEIAAVRAGEAPSSRLTPFERNALMKFGWQDGEPIPPDFSAELKNTFINYVAQKQSQGIPLDQIKINRIEDLPEMEQQRMKAVMRGMIEQMKTTDRINAAQATRTEQFASYPETIRQVLTEIDWTPTVSNEAPTAQKIDMPSQAAVSVELSPKQEVKLAPNPTVNDHPKQMIANVPVLTCNTCGHDPYREKERILCTHCGCDPLENPEEQEITMDDKRKFLIALGSKRPFEKEYTIFNETIQVRFRTLRNREFEELSLWATKAVAKEKLLFPQDMMPRVRYMELLGSVVLQTRLLQSMFEGGELFWASPNIPYPTLDDWKTEYGVGDMDELVDHFMEEIPSESVLVALQHQLTKFNQLDYRLSREATNTTNFWRET